ncbi:MAG: hypothetical protein RJA22_1123 [Verrucomicrobiota bacterium]|jgi:hypothetical protein
MNAQDWQTSFRQVYERGLAAWQAGRKSPATMFDAADAAFLASIGHTCQELFDFVDDRQRYGEPDAATALAVAALRRDYFLQVQHGQPSGRIFPMDQLPPKPQAVDGIPWLPRFLVKARLKLRGEMPPELMYGCGGDRDFVRRMGLSLPGFLELVWRHGDDDRAIITAVKKAHGA